MRARFVRRIGETFRRKRKTPKRYLIGPRQSGPHFFRRRSMRTVIIEDQEAFALDLKRWLEQSGCIVLQTATSFASAAGMLMTERDGDAAFLTLCRALQLQL